MKTLTLILSLLGSSILHSQSGMLDTSFGNNGIVITSINSKDVYTAELLINQNDKILSAGTSGDGELSNFSDLFVIQQNFDGSLDPSFGNGGKKIISISPTSDACTFMKLDQQGKIYVGGFGSQPGQGKNIELARLNTDGSLDISFGSSGYISEHFNSSFEYGFDMGIQQDGRLLIAGGIIENDNEDFLIARFQSSGILDTTFNIVGWAKFDIEGGNDEARYIYILPNDKILVLGTSGFNNPLKTIISIIRLHSNGGLDDDFGNNGKLSIEISQFWNVPVGAIIQDNEKILIGSKVGSNEFGLIRLNEDGSFDETFGVNGVISHAITNSPINSANAFVQQNDEKIIMVGFTGVYPNYQSCLVRFNSNGNIDSTFADNGVSINNLSDSINYWTNIIALPNERILVSGNAHNLIVYDHVLAKFISDLSIGVIDETVEVHEFLIYPNPFDTYEVLEYSLLNNQEISISLYSLNGQFVQTILPESERGIGRHQEILTINSNLPSGHYLLVLKGNSFLKNIKILKR